MSNITILIYSELSTEHTAISHVLSYCVLGLFEVFLSRSEIQ